MTIAKSRSALQWPRQITQQKRHVYKMVDSPVGRLTLVATDEGLAGDPVGERPPGPRAAEHRGRGRPVIPCSSRPSASSKEYFAGQRKDVRVEAGCRGTAFQRKVWNALLTIPFGETRSYGQIARQIGNPGAVRAVGAANGRNPVSIVAPCHRVIGSTGKLTGFAGGLDVKAQLLALEGARHLDADRRDLARIGIAAIAHNLGQCEQCGTDAQPRAVRCVRIDGKPHPAAVDEKIRHSSALGKVLQVAHREDRTARVARTSSCARFALRDAPYTTWHSVSGRSRSVCRITSACPSTVLSRRELNESVRHQFVAADADDNRAAVPQRRLRATS